MQELIKQLIKNKVDSHHKLEQTVRQFLRNNKDIKSIPKKKDMLKVYHEMLKKNKLKQDRALEHILVKRAVRTLSGVTIITVLTKPFPCPGNCIYCPDETKMPKSYLSDEPAAARALTLQFDPYEQVVQRIKALEVNGHPTDKVELIVKGGSWNAYPLTYQYWFILRCFQACNSNKKITTNSDRSILSSQRRLGSRLQTKKLLKKEQTKNEKTKHRIIGMTLETRPDMINKTTIDAMREMGCTRIEMGVQTTDEAILKLIKRGHDTKAVQTATILLKNAGFKVDYHLMPQLPGSTPAKDLKMMREIFSDPVYRPDMIKIYPCTVIKNTELHTWVKNKKYKPYSDRKLIDILKKLKSSLPYYVRISRLIRDIPSHHVLAGNKVTNLRQVIQAEMKKEGLKCDCLRCREIGHNIIKTLDHKNIKSFKPVLFIDKYEASGGDEYFLSYEDKNRNVVYAFCRLRVVGSVIPAKEGIHNQPLDSCLRRNDKLAFIRELHTYGQQLSFGKKDKKDSQHKGMGKKLILEAEKIVKKNKLNKLAVISGVGVRSYYRKLGYRLEDNYMVKKF